MRRPPSFIQRFHCLLYRVGLGSLIGKLVLVLTTTGRKSGLPRMTPLGYEEIQGAFYVGSVIRGSQSDWFKNALANPEVHIRVDSREFDGIAEAVTDPCRIADFIEYSLRHHPWMAGAVLASEGLSRNPKRERLEAYAMNVAMIIVRPSSLVAKCNRRIDASESGTLQPDNSAISTKHPGTR